MNLDWQNVMALGLVLAAVAYVVYRLLRAGGRDKPPGCGGACPKCPQDHPADGYCDDTTA